MSRIVVGVSGASGIILGYRMVEALALAGHHVHLVLSKGACFTAIEELGTEYASGEKWMKLYSKEVQKRVTCHSISDFSASIASGSFLTDGMIVIPCSMASLAAIALGLADNLLRRAADVVLKERRPFIVVPREAPLSEIHLENMLKITRMGGVVLPPMPAWYLHPKNMDDVESFIVARAFDALKLKSPPAKRWE